MQVTVWLLAEQDQSVPEELPEMALAVTVSDPLLLTPPLATLIEPSAAELPEMVLFTIVSVPVLSIGGIDIAGGTMALANSIVAGNKMVQSEGVVGYADIDGTYADNGGNLASNSSSATSTINPSLAALGNYGGPTQTMIPLPGSSAICAGLKAEIQNGVTTDQRGEPNTNSTYAGYSAGAPCVDAGAVQTNYSMSFTTPASDVAPNAVMTPAPTVTLDESGAPFTAAAVTIPLTLASTPSGATLSGGSVLTSAGVATYSSLSVNLHGTGDTLTANLALDASPAVSISSASGTFIVSEITPTLSFTPEPSSQTYGTAIAAGSLDATATYNSNPVAGTFAYTTTVSGNPVTLVAGTTILPAGSYTIIATFTPTAPSIYAGASTTAGYTVAQTTLFIAANNATRVYGASNPAFTGMITGQQNGDAFTESFTTTATQNSNAGAYAITPSAAGAELSDYTQSITAGALTITPAASATTLALSGTSATPGHSVTLTATVSDASAGSTGTPGGSMNFYDNGTLLNASPVALNAGVAAYSLSTLTPGITNTITAEYSGDENFSASSSTPSASSGIVVAPLDFTITLPGPAALTVMAGHSVSYQFSVTPDYGSYAGPVSFAISGLPLGATATFSPATIPPNGGPQTVTLTIQIPPAAAALAAVPPPGPKSRKAAPFALAFLLLFGVGPLRRRGRALRCLLCVLILLGAGAGASLLNGCSSGSGFFAQGQKNYTVIITATAGSVQHSTAITLDMQ